MPRPLKSVAVFVGNGGLQRLTGKSNRRAAEGNPFALFAGVFAKRASRFLRMPILTDKLGR
jgi:hypothetical protein